MAESNNPFNLPLGATGDELRELIKTPFQTDQYRRAYLQGTARQIYLLEQIAANTGSTPEEPALVGDQSPGGGGGGSSQQQTPHYWSTEEPIEVTSDVFDVQGWGFAADTVVLLFDGDLRVAFSNPDEKNTTIPLSAAESPFSIAGIDGLWASEVHFALPEDGTGPVELRIIAVD